MRLFRKALAMTAPALAETTATAPPSPLQLRPRQEAFCRYVADGLALTQAARMAGYAWNAARQHGSRLMTYPHVAARIAELVHARNQQRRGELDELVGVLKRVMMKGLSSGRDQSVLRAAEMIARLRGLTHNPARACGAPDDLDAVNDRSRPAARAAVQHPSPMAAPADGAFDPYAHPADTPDVDPDADPDFDRIARDFITDPDGDPDTDADVAFTPPMPPEMPATVEPAPPPPEPDPREHWDDRTRAMEERAFRVCTRMSRLKEAHPETRMDSVDDADLFFDDETDTILPPDQWPIRPAPGQPLVRRRDLTAEQIAHAEDLDRQEQRANAERATERNRLYGTSRLRADSARADKC